jgi:tetratricopeptide (TPR) repeat protein
MRYQFSIDRPQTQGRGLALAVVALISLGVAGYAFAACGDRNPDRASAGEPVVTTPTPLPAPPTRAEPETPTPTTAPEFYTVGRTAWKAGDFVRAESAFVQAIALDSTHVRSRLYLSRILIESGRAGDALQHIEAAVALDTSSSEPLRLLGRAYEVLGRSDEAIDAYKRSIVRNSEDVWSLNNLGSLYIKVGRSEDALGPLARAIELEKKVAIFHNNLGTALEKTGHFTAAAEAYRAALGVESTYGPATTNLSRVEQLKEDPAAQPVDLVALSKAFVEQISTWNQ